MSAALSHDAWEAIIPQLRQLWDEGHSTAEIGRRLGMSKNAIVGKAYRLDLPARPSPIRRDPDSAYARRLAQPPRAAAVTLPPLASFVPIDVATAIVIPLPAAAVKHANGKPVRNDKPIAPKSDRFNVFSPLYSRPVVPVPRPAPRELNATCRYPLWSDTDRATHRYCDKPAPLGESWCAECRKVVFTPVRRYSADAAA